MDQSVVDELSKVSIVESGNERSFRKKGSSAIKMTDRTFLQFLYNRKGGLFNHRINAYNSIRDKMEEEVEKIENNPEEADISRYATLEEKLAKIGAKILWAEEKENYVKRKDKSAKKLKVPSILIKTITRTIAPFRNFFVRKKYKNLYKKQMELAANTVLQNAIKGNDKGFNIPSGEDLTLKSLHENKKEESKPKEVGSPKSNGALPLEKVPSEVKTEDDIKKHLEFYFKKIGSYSEEEYKNVLKNLEKSAKDINFNISDYLKMNFKDYVKDFVLNVDVKNPTDEDRKTFFRYDEIANNYHVDFAKTREEILKEEEERLLKLKEKQSSPIKGQINQSERTPVNSKGQTIKYQPFDWSKYKKKEPENVNEDVNDETVDKVESSSIPKSNKSIHNSGRYQTSSFSSTAKDKDKKNNSSSVDVNDLYKEYNPAITYDYNYGVINDDLRNLSENELIKEEKKINEAFLSYVLLKHGKSPRELLSNIQEYVEETNKQRIEHNKELQEENARDISRKELPLLNQVEEIPQDYYLHSIYSNEFFKDNPNQYERTQKLANEVMRRAEEKEKAKQEELAKIKEQEKIRTGRLVLKYGLGGYYADPNTKLNDQEVLDMIDLLEKQNLYKDATRRAGMKVRQIKEERIRQQPEATHFIEERFEPRYHFMDNPEDMPKTR